MCSIPFLWLTNTAGSWAPSCYSVSDPRKVGHFKEYSSIWASLVAGAVFMGFVAVDLEVASRYDSQL